MDIGLVIITLSIIVLFIVVVQFNQTLGKRTGNEKSINNMQAIKNIKEKLVTTEDNKNMPEQIINVENILNDIDELAEKDSDINKKLRKIYDSDKNFSPKNFINNAIDSYEKALNAFAKENISDIEGILAPDVKGAFEAKLAEYKTKEEKIDFHFIGNAKADIIDIKIIENIAYIAMRFVSEAVFALKDKEEQIICGRSNDLTILDEKWLFAKAMNEAMPWRIAATTY